MVGSRTGSALAASSGASRPVAKRGPARRFQWFAPGWPLTYFITGYPLWWVLGLTQLLLIVAAVIMAVELVRAGRVRVRAGFGWWLLFLAWVCIGVFLLQVNAPGAQPGGSNARYVTFVYRVLLYLAATSVLLYVYNFRSRISTMRILRAFAWFFVTVVAGGLLGTVAPYLSFPSAMELILPHGITHIGFVQTLIHPRVAQVINPAHPTGTPRTSAPFTYTNDWGLSFACLLPFFLLAWFDRNAGWRRFVGPLILLVAIYPVVQSANRGLWIALVVSGGIVVVRAMVFGNIKFAATAVIAAAAAVGALLSSSLGSTVIYRATNAGSAGTRSQLGLQALRSVMEKSPLAGFGGTRLVQGSYYSIAGGDSANCVGCAPPPLGTQGHFWLVVFSTGYGGLVLYLGFILIQLFRHIRLRTPLATLGIVLLVVHLTTMAIYDTIGVSLFIIFAAIGLLWQEQARSEDASAGARRRESTVVAYAALAKRRWPLVALFAMLGTTGGLVIHEVHATKYEATTSVSVPASRPVATGKGGGSTVDTIAVLARSPQVRSAVQLAVGSRHAPDRDHFYVTAKANSRVLELHVVDRRPAFAVRASRAAGAALIAVRQDTLQAQRDDMVLALEQQRAGDLKGVATIAAMRVADPSATPLTRERSQLTTDITALDKRIVALQAPSLNPGSVLATAPAAAQNDAWLVAGSSGLMVGLTAAVLVLLLGNARGRRLRARRDRVDLPVLARLSCPSDGSAPDPAGLERVLGILARLGPPVVLSADDSLLACTTATRLGEALEPLPEVGPRLRHPVVLVASPSTRDRSVDHARTGMAAVSTPVLGVILLSKKRRRAARKTHTTLTLTQVGRPQERHP